MSDRSRHLRHHQRDRGRRHHVAPTDQPWTAASLLSMLVTVAMFGYIAWQVQPHLALGWAKLTRTPAQLAAEEASVYYAGCDQARAAGKAPIYRGQPGYRTGMDGDLDGIACEPYS